MPSFRQSALIAALTACVLASPANAADTTITFEDGGAAGAPPAGFTAATTGAGSPADWRLTDVNDAPSGKRVIAQQSADRPNMRFPLLIHETTSAANVELSVKFKAISGVQDQAAGLVWRYQDANTYYVVRANALEDNVVLYSVINGRRVDLPLKGQGRTYGAKAPVAKGAWNTLSVVAQGALFRVSLNGNALFEVEDTAITKAGKVGLWTKADSVMQFDDLTIRTLAP